MPLSRCFSSLGCPEFSLDETLALAVKHDVPAVELRALGGTIGLADYFAREFGSPEALAARLRGSPVRLAAFNASLHLVGATAAERDQLVAFAPWADAVGVRWLRVFDGGSAADAAEFAGAAEVIRWWRGLRQARGWRTDVMVETHDSLFTSEAIRRFLAAVPGTAILWDAHHTWRKGGEEPVATWQAIRAGVVHVHVKDSVDRPSARHPYTYVLPGDGEFPAGRLLAALRADGFDGPVSLEWERMWHPYLPPLDEALHVAGARGWW
jgi:sugar phosphate isomerase/epimerase